MRSSKSSEHTATARNALTPCQKLC